MKNSLVVLVLAMSLATVAQQTEHAPTLESCVADLNLWEFEMHGWPNPSSAQEREATKRLTFDQINHRVISLAECMDAHPGLAKNKGPDSANESLTLADIYNAELQLRLSNFIDRHGLTQKFMDEDAAGKR